MATSPERAIKRFAKACRDTGIGFSLGALDFSYNEEPSNSPPTGVPARLVVHVWAFAKSHEVDSARKLLKRTFPTSSKTPRPVKVYPYDGSLKAIAYAFKGDFSRRVKVPARIGPDGKATCRQNTRQRFLRARQKVEPAVLMNRLGLYDRLIMRNVEFVQTPAGIRLQLQSQEV